MYRWMRVHIGILAILALVLTIALLASNAIADEEYLTDVVLSGVYSNTTIDAWGNVTVPEDATLVLINVTLVFHPDDNLRGLFGKAGCIIKVLDGDGDPDTVADGSIITSTTSPWIITIVEGEAFTLRNSALDNIGIDMSEPNGRQINQWEIEANTIDCIHSTIDLADGYVCFIGTDININASQLISNQNSLKGLVFTSQRLNITDSEAKMIGIQFKGELTSTVERCSFIVCAIYSVDALNAVYRNCIFDRSELATEIEGVVRFTIEDCRFVGPINSPIVSWAESLVVQGCVFDDVGTAIKGWGDSIQVTDCQIEASNGIYGLFNNISISNCSIEAVIVGIDLYWGEGLANISDVQISNCHDGILIDRWNGPFIMRDCQLENVSGTGLVIGSGSTLSIERCRFLNVSSGINFTSTEQSPSSAVVSDSVFKCSEFTMILSNVNLSVVNVTIEGGPNPKEGSLGIMLTAQARSMEIPVIISRTSISNFSIGVSLMSDTFRSMTAKIDELALNNCNESITASFLGALSMTNITVERFLQAINISGSGEVFMDDVLLTNGTDGLIMRACHRVQLEYIGLKDLRGKAIDQESIDEAVWNISREQVLNDLRISVAKNVIVTSDLTMRWVDLEIRTTSLDDEGFNISNGSRLIMDNSTIRGEASHPTYIRFHDAATVVARDSSFAFCGGYYEAPSKRGPTLEGGSHYLVRTTIEDCWFGLNLIDTEVTLVGCNINGSFKGISSTGSDITLQDCHIDNTRISIDIIKGVLTADNVSFNATEWAIGLDMAEVYVSNSTIATADELTLLVSSTLHFINTHIIPPSAPSGTVTNSELVLYDTLYQGEWTLNGPNTSVRVYWHLDLSAVNRWDQRPAEGANVTIHDGLDLVAPILQGTIGVDGTLPRIWLLERMEDISQETVHAPFRVVVEIPGVRGEVDVPGDAPWDGILELVDISPPDLDIQSPEPGTFLNATLVSFDGTIEEIGSGLLKLEGSLDGGFWEPLDVTLGRWSIQLDAYDGIHNLSVRASDLDGNLVIAETWVIVDTVLPLVSFTDPAPSTPFPLKTVILRGFIHLGEGTPIVRFHVADVLVPLSPDGTFEVNVTLLEEGENEFVVEAWDGAGNRGEARLALVRDTMSPVVHLDDFPALTRSTSLLVNGTIDDVTRVEVTLDGRFVSVTDDGAFTIDVDLHLGKNRMLLEVVDGVGNRVSRDLEVVCDYLLNGTIVYPIQGAIVRGPNVKVEVTTDPNTWVRVFNLTEWTLSHSNGTVVLNVELEPGENQTLTIEFRDDANNTLVREVVITVRKPLTEGSQEGLPLWLILFVGVLALVVIILAVILRMNDGPPV